MRFDGGVFITEITLLYFSLRKSSNFDLFLCKYFTNWINFELLIHQNYLVFNFTRRRSRSSISTHGSQIHVCSIRYRNFNWSKLCSLSRNYFVFAREGKKSLVIKIKHKFRGENIGGCCERRRIGATKSTLSRTNEGKKERQKGKFANWERIVWE